MNNADISSKSQTNWARLQAMSDEEIDFSDIPELTEAQLRAMRPTAELIPGLATISKKRITIRLDSDVIHFFKARATSHETNYQTLINVALRDFMVRATNESGLRALVREIVQEELAKAA